MKYSIPLFPDKYIAAWSAEYCKCNRRTNVVLSPRPEHTEDTDLDPRFPSL